MKKGLRRLLLGKLLTYILSERCPDEEGIKTYFGERIPHSLTSERCPDEEGIKTLTGSRISHGLDGKNGALMKKGLRRDCLVYVRAARRQNGALMKKGLRPKYIGSCKVISRENDALQQQTFNK